MNILKNLLHQLFFLRASTPFATLFGSLLALFFTWYTLALLGAFFMPLIALTSALWLSFVALLLYHTHILRSSQALLGVLIFGGLFSAAIITHPLELVSGGRDQGTFTQSALLLANQGSLHFSLPEATAFFQIYGPGKALNFPGMHYTQDSSLTPSFPLAYIVWLGGFASLFGAFGITIANGVLFLLTSWLIFLLLRPYFSFGFSFFLTLLFELSFLPLWFASFTLSENLALPLFLATVYFTRIWLERKTDLFMVLGSATALALCRIEGFAILALVLFLILFFEPKSYKLFCTKIGSKAWLTLYPLSFLLLATLFFNTAYYRTIVKALLGNASPDNFFGDIDTDSRLLPLYKTLLAYGLLPLFLLGIISAAFFLLTWWQKKRTLHAFFPLLPLFLALPTLPYLVLPHITPDAPWMLRRFLFTLYPTFFLLFWWCVAILTKNISSGLRLRSLLLTIASLFIIQLSPLLAYWNTRYTITLDFQAGALATLFLPSDLLLIDKDTTGDNFMMPISTLGTLHGRPNVYFFNPSDLTNLDTSAFRRVFLLIPEKNVPRYQEDLGARLTPYKDFTFVNDHSFRTNIMEERVLPILNIHTSRVRIFQINK